MVVEPQNGHKVWVKYRHGQGMPMPVIAYIPLNESPITPRPAADFSPAIAVNPAAPALFATPPL